MWSKLHIYSRYFRHLTVVFEINNIPLALLNRDVIRYKYTETPPCFQKNIRNVMVRVIVLTNCIESFDQVKL